MVARGFEVGDLVWAKMKGYPDWPGKINEPPNGADKKGKHYIYFFGSKNYSWIADDKIKYHTEDMLKSLPKKKYAFFEEAVGEITTESKKWKGFAKITAIEDVQTINENEDKEPALKKSPKKRKSEIPLNLFPEETKPESSKSKKGSAKKRRLSADTNNSASSSKKAIDDYTSLFLNVLPSMGVDNPPGKRGKKSVKKPPRNKRAKKSVTEPPRDKRVDESDTEPLPDKRVDESVTEPLPDERVDELVTEPLPDKRVDELVTEPLPDKRLKEFVTEPPPDKRLKEFVTERPEPILSAAPKISKPDPKTSKPEAKPKQEAPTSSPRSKNIGFIGLGMMGQGMVKNLLISHHSVTIWNKTLSKCDQFVEMGAVKALTPAEVVRKSDITFCCVSDPHAVRTVMFGENGVLKGFENCPLKSKGYVEMSTIDAETSVEIAEAVEDAGMKYLEAPMIGSKSRAEAGSILILGAGDRELFHDCETCFHAMSNHAYYISCTVGRSASINIITNMFLGTTYAALAEALALTDRIKISKNDLLEILELRGICAPMVMEKGRRICNSIFQADTSLKHQQKDLELALQMSDACDQPLPIARAANEVYKHAKQLGCTNEDIAAVYQGAWF